MFPFQVNESIVINLIQPQERDELYTLIDENRMHLREWLPRRLRSSNRDVETKL